MIERGGHHVHLTNASALISVIAELAWFEYGTATSPTSGTSTEFSALSWTRGLLSLSSAHDASALSSLIAELA